MARQGGQGGESRWEIFSKLSERCVTAQGICMVGFILFLMLLSSTCWAGFNGSKELLPCVNEGCRLALWVALCFVGARFFGRSSKEGGLFREGRARELKAISKLAIASSFVPGLVTWLLGMVLLACDVDPLLTQGVTTFGQIIDIPSLYAGFIIGAFALIISYGCVLQQQDDGLV